MELVREGVTESGNPEPEIIGSSRENISGPEHLFTGTDNLE